MIIPDRVHSIFPVNERLAFLDFFRGCVMFVLLGEATGFYELLADPNLKGSLIYQLGLQFQHRFWTGLNLWDLGQPCFMLVSGVALFYSDEKRRRRGDSPQATLAHALKRSLLLLFLGWALYQINPSDEGFRGAFLMDMLPQLAFANIIAFLLIKRSAIYQIGVTAGLLILTELLYRLVMFPGSSQPFMPGHNFGAYIDTLAFGRASAENWASFNIVPSISYVIIGVLSGRFLGSERARAAKTITLGAAGLVCLTLGLAISTVTPVIRRICTSSFVLVSLGLALSLLGLAYWAVEVLRMRGVSRAFEIVGMNSLVLYLVAMSGGSAWLEHVVRPFALSYVGCTGRWLAYLIMSVLIWTLLWALGYWLFKRRVIIKI
jgi:predicted acyltransferase